MSHKCNRDDCHPVNVAGPKIKCSKCNNICFIKCFGLVNTATVNGLDVVEIPLSNGALIVVPVAFSAFSCCGKITSTALKQAIKKPERGTSKGRQPQTDSTEKTELLAEISAVKLAISELNECSTKSLTELAEIKSVTSKSLKFAENFVSVGRSNRIIGNNVVQSPSYAHALGNAPQAGKRRLSASQPAPPKPSNLPPPKVGTRNARIGPPVEIKSKDNNQPKFPNSVWISQLHPSVTVDEISKFIIEETAVKSKDKFECFKLVKKDADITKLKFVSFKVNIDDEHFEHMMDPATWPQGVTVREFIQKPTPVTLGRFFPETPNRNKLARTTSPSLMEQ